MPTRLFLLRIIQGSCSRNFCHKNHDSCHAGFFCRAFILLMALCFVEVLSTDPQVRAAEITLTPLIVRDLRTAHSKLVTQSL
jgi:hypothetical protein